MNVDLCANANAGANTSSNWNWHAGSAPTSARASTWRLPCGTAVALRAIRPEDASELGELVQRISQRSRRWRFHTAVGRLSATALRHMACVAGPEHAACVITVNQCGREHIVADARYSVDALCGGAELSVMVEDRWQRRGLGARALCALELSAHGRGVRNLTAQVMDDNEPMQALMWRCGYVEEDAVRAEGLIPYRKTLDATRGVDGALPHRTRWASLRRNGLAAALGLALAVPAALAQTSRMVAVKDWDVFVDPPTRFAFVKTPTRWVFVRQLDAEQMKRLHPSTLTSLLRPEVPEDDLAQAAAMQSRPICAASGCGGSTSFAPKAAP